MSEQQSTLSVESHNADALQKAANTTERAHRLIVGVDDDTGSGIAGRLIKHTGSHPGKYNPPVALSTHIINAMIAGSTTYIYDRIVRDGESIDIEKLRLLIGALALHDANKIVQALYDPPFDTDQNTEDVIDYYFDQGDVLGVQQILPGEKQSEQKRDRMDLKWLIQRTETNDQRRGTRMESTPRARSLERYCRIGDGLVSKVGVDGIGSGADWLSKFFSDEKGHVHLLEFTEIEQPILNDHLIATVKQVIEKGVSAGQQDIPTQGVVLGSSPSGVLYLGSPIDRDALKHVVEDHVMKRITDMHDFSAKTNWNAFEYDILSEIDIPFDDKRETIAEGYAETLRQGSGTDHEFENIPDNFKSTLPELAKLVFRDQNYEDAFADYPAMENLWQQIIEGDEYNAFSRKIGFIAELLRHWEGSVQDAADADTVRDELTDFAEDHREGLKEDLTPDSEAGSVIVSRFFGELETDISTPSGGEMCFLCGRAASREFKKGNNAFYKTNSFSKRVAPEEAYKRICPVCNLEHALLRDAVEDHDYSVGPDIEIAFVYYDEFIGNLSVGTGGTPNRLVRSLLSPDDSEEGTDRLTNPDLVASSFEAQYHLQPLYIDSENTRLRSVRELLEEVVSAGFKVVLGKPFTRFKPQDALFVDFNSTRRQTAFGADRVESYQELQRVCRLFDILRAVAESSDYSGGRELISIPEDSFVPIADLVARESAAPMSVREQAHKHFLENPHHDQYMQMRNVAQEGIDLYGHEYDSRHKKTKIFRLAVDATLDGLNRGMEVDELQEHVAGQIYKTAQEDAGFAKTEQATAFTEALFEYLKVNDSFDKASLSQRRNTLANTYLFAYDRLLSEYHADDEGKDESNKEPA